MILRAFRVHIDIGHIYPYILLALMFIVDAGYVGAYEGFSDPVDSFRFLSDQDSVRITDDAIYRTGYYSINGSDWRQFSFQGAEISAGWLNGSASADLPEFGEGMHYIIAYSCTKGQSWDCHNREWQIISVTKAANSGTDGSDGLHVFYLSPDGNDAGSGKKDDPWFTLQRAWKTLKPGDTLYLLDGKYEYSAKQTLSGVNGDDNDRINIYAYPGAHPHIIAKQDFDFGYWPKAVILFTGNNFHWKGIEISDAKQRSDGVGGFGLFVRDSDDNVFETLDIHDNMNGMSIYGDSTGNLILNSDFHHNMDPYSQDRYGDSDGLAIGYSPDGTENTVRGSRMYWNSDDGLDLWENDGKVIIENSWSFYNGYVPGTFDEGGDGCGFKYGKSDDDHSKAIAVTKNSIAYKNKKVGFHQNGAAGPLEFYNDIAYDNNDQGFWLGSFGKEHILMNNIDYGNGEFPELTDESILKNNTFIKDADNPAFKVSDDDFESLSGSQLMGKRGGDGSLPDISFLHLASGSDLIDMGFDVGLPFKGNAPDLGAFESPYSRDPGSSDFSGNGGSGNATPGNSAQNETGNTGNTGNPSGSNLKSGKIIVDHKCTDVSDIPSCWIDNVKEDLKIAYAHTSHGSQIISGMDALEAYDSDYSWSDDISDGKLYLEDYYGGYNGAADLSAGEGTWYDATREFLDDNPDINVIMWSWCSIAGHDVEDNYIDNMKRLVDEYSNGSKRHPDPVVFVLMTGHAEGGGEDDASDSRNSIIRDYCDDSDNCVLFDFADMENYDPDGNYYLDKRVEYSLQYDCASPYDSGDKDCNWGDEYLKNHEGSKDAKITGLVDECAHSSSVTCALKGQAAWYLWARIAGWDGKSSGCG